MLGEQSRSNAAVVRNVPRLFGPPVLYFDCRNIDHEDMSLWPWHRYQNGDELLASRSNRFIARKEPQKEAPAANRPISLSAGNRSPTFEPACRHSLGMWPRCFLKSLSIRLKPQRSYDRHRTQLTLSGQIFRMIYSCKLYQSHFSWRLMRFEVCIY
jgi:hypothetical protein